MCCRGSQCCGVGALMGCICEGVNLLTCPDDDQCAWDLKNMVSMTINKLRISVNFLFGDGAIIA